MIFAVDHPLCDVWNILIGVQDFCWPKFINPLGQKSAFGRFLSCVGISTDGNTSGPFMYICIQWFIIKYLCTNLSIFPTLKSNLEHILTFFNHFSKGFYGIIKHLIFFQSRRGKNIWTFEFCKTNLLDDYSNLHNLRTFCQFGNFHKQLLLGQLLFSMCSFPSFSFRSYCCYFRILHLSLIEKMRVLKRDIEINIFPRRERRQVLINPYRKDRIF